MSVYKNILTAIDFSKDSQMVVDRAVHMATTNNTRISLLHAVEFISPDYMSDSPIPQNVEMDQELIRQAERQLQSIAQKTGLTGVQCYTPMGSPKHEIIRTADEISADLIVIGSHGRHGLQLLLGSTANGVLHLAKCDVLAVRVSD